MKIAKAVLEKAIGLGRATATVMGLAVLLALTVGLASTALAGTGVGARFDLGVVNAVNATSSLVGSVSGPTLAVKNEASNRAASALRLEMENPNLAPMQTNASGRVVNLNADLLDGTDSSQFLGASAKAADADKLDGKDSSAFASGVNGKATDADKLDGLNSTSFWTGKVYNLGSSPKTGTPFAETFHGAGPCDSGDTAINGNYRFIDSTGNHEIVREQLFPNSFSVSWTNGPTADTLEANVTCADFPPFR